MGGITKSNGGLVRITAPVVLAVNQTWNLDNALGNLRWTNTLNSGAFTLLIQGIGTLQLQGGIRTFGSEVTISSAALQVDGGGTITLGGTNTFDGLTINGNSRAIGSTYGRFWCGQQLWRWWDELGDQYGCDVDDGHIGIHREYRILKPHL